MIKLVKSALGWIGASRDWLTLLLVAAVASWLYVQYATVRADRDALAGLARQLCAAAGSELQPDGTPRRDRGKTCRTAVLRLANYERDSQRETAATLADAMRARALKQSTDIDAARRAAEAARDAARNMEKTNAAIGPDNRVDGNWFADLNRTAGLHPPAR